jgi:hypothetical protein
MNLTRAELAATCSGVGALKRERSAAQLMPLSDMDSAEAAAVPPEEDTRANVSVAGKWEGRGRMCGTAGNDAIMGTILPRIGAPDCGW